MFVGPELVEAAVSSALVVVETAASGATALLLTPAVCNFQPSQNTAQSEAKPKHRIAIRFCFMPYRGAPCVEAENRWHLQANTSGKMASSVSLHEKYRIRREPRRVA